MAETEQSAVTTSPPAGGGVGFGVTSLVTGILACLTGIFFWISLPLGIVAIIFAALGMKRPASKGLSVAGLVTGIVGVAFGGVMLLTLIFAAATNQSTTTF